MSFNNNSTTDLSRFSIGEIQDLSGVPTFYNAGSSKWLRSATRTASSNLSATTKTTLASAATATDTTIIMQSALAQSYVNSGYYATYPIERISASSISVIPSSYLNTTAVGVGVMTSAGLQTVATGQTSNRTNSTTLGTNAFVASNNTTIFSYCFTSATALSAYYTTTGTTWTAGAVTGIPVFATDGDTTSHASNISSGRTLMGQNGVRRNKAAAATQFAVFWCGARFVLLAPAATNYMVSLSTDGLAWGGDNTTAVIGATARAKTLDIQFYRNGNNCYLNVGGAYRFTTDGGVTWAACTFVAAPDPSTYFLQYNQTDPAKLVILVETATTAYYSADSGATWSADRPLPLLSYGGVAYRGSTVVCSNATNNTQVSTNNGTTWVASTLPIGTLSANMIAYADANRFYLGIYNQAQILTSSDGVTWTIVTTPINFTISYVAWGYGGAIIAFDSNTVVIYGYNGANAGNIFFSTTDGGVTWVAGQFVISTTGGGWTGGNVYLTPDAGGIAICTTAENNLVSPVKAEVFKTDVVAGGAFYRTGVTAITPTKVGAFAYVRVG